MKIFNKWRLILILIIVAIGVTYYYKQKASANKSSVQSHKVQKGELLQRVTIAGVVQALKSTIVTAP
jgi:hypothetical protein